MSRKPRWTKTLASAAIVRGALYFEDVRQCGLEDDLAEDILSDPALKAIRVVSISADWTLRVCFGTGVERLEDLNVEMTLRKERRGVRDHWYAYRRVFGTLHKRYVGQELTEAALVKVAQALPSR